MGQSEPITIIMPSPLGLLGLIIEGAELVKLDYLTTSHSSKIFPIKKASTSFAKEVVLELEQYFHDGKHEFTVPLKLIGTELEKQIWQILRKIPAGQTMTYGELATKIGTGPRVIGNACCRKNPIPIVIPCHRVVAKNDVGDYCGSKHMIQHKIWLLNHEAKRES